MFILHRAKNFFWKELYKAGEFLSYQLGLPFISGVSNRRDFWNDQAESLHARWGEGDWDFRILSQIIQRYQVQSVLDVGCGSGRLFPLYEQRGVRKVLGVDISERALGIANRRFPGVSTLCLAIDKESLPAGSWDLAISNRVLQHIPEAKIDLVIDKLCASCNLVYVNELSESDREHELFFMRFYDFGKLFHMRGYKMLEQGVLDKQTYRLFGRR